MQCPDFNQKNCRSCSLLETSYEDTLIFKKNHLSELFPEHVHLISPPIGLSNDISGSRSKAKLAIFPKNNGIAFGFYNSMGVPTELEHCPLHAEGINSLLASIKIILMQHQLSAYDLQSKTGELKYLLLSSNNNKQHPEFLLRFVLRSKKLLTQLKRASDVIKQQYPMVKVITANIQPIHQAIIEGEEEIVLTDKKTIAHPFDEFTLTLGAKSFFQVTPEIAKVLYNTLANTVKEQAPESLLDLYCGVGAFSFYASRHCKEVTGVEISKEAIDCANESVKMNQNQCAMTFHAMDAEHYLKTTSKNFDAILVNPPRRGLNTTIIEIIKTLNPRFIYYSSCNAQTMHRDFLALQNDYVIHSLHIFDMFPYTPHYETLMCLTRGCG